MTDINKNVKLKYIVDDKEAVKSLDDMSKNLKDVEKQTDKVDKETKEFSKTLDKNADALMKNKKATDEAKKSQQGFIDTLAEAPGIVGQVGQSIKGLGVAFKALLANPVVLVLSAIVATLGALFKASQRSEKGQKAFAVASAAVGAALDVLLDVLTGVTDTLIDAFTNPQQAIEDFGNSIKEFVLDRVNGIIKGLGLLGESISLLFEGEFSAAASAAAEGFKEIAVNATPVGFVLMRL